MLYFKGKSAFTDFRLNQISYRLREILPTFTTIQAFYGYFADTSSELDTIEVVRLASLLPEAEIATLPSSDYFSCWVIPRLGTISPWSSKATEIARICDLNKVSRVERGIYFVLEGVSPSLDAMMIDAVTDALHDRMTESVVLNSVDLNLLFDHHAPQKLSEIDILNFGREAIVAADKDYGFALSEAEIDFLVKSYRELKRNPTDAELMMFAQVNSEHCRHHIFNATFVIDDKLQDKSPFGMIRNTFKLHPNKTIVAYKDNAAVIGANKTERFYIDPETKRYQVYNEEAPFVLKVETHNHPTAISPFPGAATGSGGEIRDEAATGRGAVPKAGLCGFSVSHLNIPELKQPWEINTGKPSYMASSLDIMLEGPIGAAAFNNEFGRPNVCGYFRTLEMNVEGAFGMQTYGYHKPIMIAGGVGNIRPNQVEKKDIPIGSKLIVLGGPAMAIGLGGGSASSLSSGASSEALDFASVQRANPEMQRRAQEVINVCWSMGDNNPILSIHDVGAGGLSNAMPELVEACERGAHIQLREIPNAAPGMTPMEIWCNEAQERFVLAIKPENQALFERICERERCVFAVVGEAIKDPMLIVEDKHFNNAAVDIPMDILFPDMPKQQRNAERSEYLQPIFLNKKIELSEAAKRVLQFPSVGDKKFLITIGDRSVGGLIARDQMVGRWQVPVADCAVMCNSFSGYEGEALAMGERTPIAIVHPAASARMAVGEAITNIAAASIEKLSDITLSANWMAAPNELGEGAALYDAVQTVGMELCPALGINIPVGKDSLSMRTGWLENDKQKSVLSPVSLIISAVASVTDVRKTLTPELQQDVPDTELILIDLGCGANAMAGSVLAQVYQQIGQVPPDVDNPALIKNFFNAIQALNKMNLLLAYHDRSDGGLFATLCEMAFASHVGLTIDIAALGSDVITALFTEELGAVVQVRSKHLSTVFDYLDKFDLVSCSHVLGKTNITDEICIKHSNREVYRESRVQLQRWWSETSFRMQALRDNSECAQQEYDAILNTKDRGLSASLTFDVNEDITAPYISLKERPKVAILREQGVNGHVEMAAAFYHAGFDSVDVHMSDIISGKVDINAFSGFAACGGFSYGDVLGAGRGWAQSILMHDKVRESFSTFFKRNDAFALGVCNGCQMLSQLKDIILGAENWPRFMRNQSEQFEARVSLVKLEASPSIFLRRMEGSVLPVVVSHGEGRAVFSNASHMKEANNHLVVARYVDFDYQSTEVYPSNPNGSPQGITGLTTASGRVTILMPHPERVFRNIQNSWRDKAWGEEGPWMRMFRNARVWIEEQK